MLISFTVLSSTGTSNTLLHLAEERSGKYPTEFRNKTVMEKPNECHVIWTESPMFKFREANSLT